MKWLIIFFLLCGPGKGHAMSVYEAMQESYHGTDIVFVKDRHPIKPPHCPPNPVPAPAALWLFLSSLAGVALIARR